MMFAPRAAVKVAAVVIVAGLAATACGSVKMGAAAIAGDSRISSGTLTTQVANLSAAYRADRAKGITPQRDTSQEAQQVLTWLITFRIYDKVAADNHISVTPAQAQTQLSGLGGEASQNGVTLDQYVSAAGALPPDLKPQLGRYLAILNALGTKLAGGKAPTTTADQTKVSNAITRQQCLASKSLGVKVNPQYGQFDYNTYSVVPAASALAADPTPSPSSSPVKLTPPC